MCEAKRLVENLFHKPDLRGDGFDGVGEKDYQKHKVFWGGERSCGF